MSDSVLPPAGSDPAASTTRPGIRRYDWRRLTLFLFTVTGVIFCFCFVRELLFPITGAITLAVVAHDPMRWLRRRFSPTLSATLMLIALILAVILPGLWVFRNLLHELIEVSHFIERGELKASINELTWKHPRFGPILNQALEQILPGNSGQTLAQRASRYLGRGFRELLRLITELVLMLFFLWFLLRDEKRAVRTACDLLPLPQAQSINFVHRLGEVAHAIFLGRFLIAALQGLLAGIAYFLLGVPGSLLWGVVTALGCLVPALGAFLVWVPITLYLGLEVSWTRALILLLWCGTLVSFLDSVLYPILVGRRTDLHTAVIVTSLLGGVALFGISGFVLGPVIVAATALLLRTWRTELAA